MRSVRSFRISLLIAVAFALCVQLSNGSSNSSASSGTEESSGAVGSSSASNGSPGNRTASSGTAGSSSASSGAASSSSASSGAASSSSASSGPASSSSASSGPASSSSARSGSASSSSASSGPESSSSASSGAASSSSASSGAASSSSASSGAASSSSASSGPASSSSASSGPASSSSASSGPASSSSESSGTAERSSASSGAAGSSSASSGTAGTSTAMSGTSDSTSGEASSSGPNNPTTINVQTTREPNLNVTKPPKCPAEFPAKYGYGCEFFREAVLGIVNKDGKYGNQYVTETDRTCQVFHSEPLSFAMANEKCRQAGGRLPHIFQDGIDKIAQLVNRTKHDHPKVALINGGLWVGLTGAKTTSVGEPVFEWTCSADASHNLRVDDDSRDFMDHKLFCGRPPNHAGAAAACDYLSNHNGKCLPFNYHSPDQQLPFYCIADIKGSSDPNPAQKCPPHPNRDLSNCQYLIATDDSNSVFINQSTLARFPYLHSDRCHILHTKPQTFKVARESCTAKKSGYGYHGRLPNVEDGVTALQQLLLVAMQQQHKYKEPTTSEGTTPSTGSITGPSSTHEAQTSNRSSSKAAPTTGHTSEGASSSAAMTQSNSTHAATVVGRRRRSTNSPPNAVWIGLHGHNTSGPGELQRACYIDDEDTTLKPNETEDFKQAMFCNSEHPIPTNDTRGGAAGVCNTTSQQISQCQSFCWYKEETVKLPYYCIYDAVCQFQAFNPQSCVEFHDKLLIILKLLVGSGTGPQAVRMLPGDLPTAAHGILPHRKCLVFVNQPTSWRDASWKCLAAGGGLAWVVDKDGHNSPLLAQHMRWFADNQLGGKNATGFWVGARQYVWESNTTSAGDINEYDKEWHCPSGTGLSKKMAYPNETQLIDAHEEARYKLHKGFIDTQHQLQFVDELQLAELPYFCEIIAHCADCQPATTVQPETATIPAPVPPPSPAPTPAPEPPEPTEPTKGHRSTGSDDPGARKDDPTTEPGGSAMPAVYAAVGAVLLMLAVGAVILVVRKTRRKDKLEEEEAMTKTAASDTASSEAAAPAAVSGGVGAAAGSVQGTPSVTPAQVTGSGNTPMDASSVGPSSTIPDSSGTYSEGSSSSGQGEQSSDQETIEEGDKSASDDEETSGSSASDSAGSADQDA